MKFKVETIQLEPVFGWTTNKGEGIYVTIPIGVTEGFVREMADMRETAQPDDSDGSRAANLKVLDLALDWNFDDDDGKPIPLTRTIKAGTRKGDDRRLEILSILPIELPGYLATRAVQTKALTDQVEGFSKTSSGS